MKRAGLGPRQYYAMGLTVLIGVFSGVAGTIVPYMGSYVLYDLKQNAVASYLAEGRVMEGFIIWLLFSIGFSVLAAFLVLRIAPAAIGSGVPECKTYLNGALYKGLLERPTFPVAATLALSLAVASDLPVGVESPLMHICASLACLVCKKWQASEHRIARDQRLFVTDRPRIMFITVAAASGLAAAFRSPLGGVVFCFEELATHWNFEAMNRCCIAAALASMVVCYCLAGSNLAADTEDRHPFDISVISLESIGHAAKIPPIFRMWEIVVLVLIGAMGGVVGATFVGLTSWISRFRKKHMPEDAGMRFKLLEIAVITFIAGVLLVLLPNTFDCRELNKVEGSNIGARFRVFWREYDCKPGQFNELASLTMNNKERVLNNLFTGSFVMDFHPITTLTYALIIFLLTAVTFGSSLPCGVLLPQILVGAALGRTIGHFLQDNVEKTVAVRFYSLMGAASVFAGTVRMTLSVTVILMELVSSSVMGAPIMVAAMVSKLVGDALSPSFYDSVAQNTSLPTLTSVPPASFDDHTVYDVMTEMDHGMHYMPVCLSEVEEADYIEQVLSKTTHNGFPVVKDRSSDVTLTGLVKRAELQALLREKEGQVLLNEKVDVKGVMELSPWCIEESTPSARVYQWFVAMGMRHLVVTIDGSRQVAGIITRHDWYESLINWEAEVEEEKEQRRKQQADKSASRLSGAAKSGPSPAK